MWSKIRMMNKQDNIPYNDCFYRARTRLANDN